MSYTIISWQRLDKCTNALFQTTPIYPYSCDPCMCFFESANRFVILNEEKTTVVNYTTQDNPSAPIIPGSERVGVGSHLRYNFGKPTGFEKLCIDSIAIPISFFAGLKVGSTVGVSTDPTVSTITPLSINNPGNWAISNDYHKWGFSTYINTPVSTLTLSYLGETLFTATLNVTRKVYGFTDPGNVDTMVSTDGAGIVPSPTDSIKMFPDLSYNSVHSITDAHDATGTPINYPNDLVAGTLYNAHLFIGQEISFTVAADDNGVVDTDTWYMSGFVYDGPIDPTVDAVFDLNIDSLTPWGMSPGQGLVSGWGYNGASMAQDILWYARHRLQ